MADVIIPKADPTPSFVPTPVATPSVTQAATPSASPTPVATPSTPAPATPATPATPGVVAPTTPNSNASAPATGIATVKDAAKPDAPAVAVPPTPPSNPIAAAATKVQGAVDAAKTAVTAAKTAATPKSTASATAAAQLDVLAPVNANIKKMLEGDDPVARIQFNNLMNAVGPQNQAMLQGMGMKLAQQHLDGQGAGTALMDMMARDNGYTTDQLIANITSDSAKRLADMNTWGFQQATQIAQAAETQKRQDLQTFISTGQTAAAKGAFEQLFPGVPFNESAIKAADPTRTASFNSRMKVVDQFVTQGNAAQAKDAFMRLATDMPEMFGFQDAASATAALSGVDFSTEAWQNNLSATNAASTAARTAALQGDDAALSAAIDQKFSKMTPASIESIATNAAKLPLDQVNKILAASGMAPVQTSDEAAMLDKTKFAKAVETYNTKTDSKKDVVDNLLDQFGKADPAILVDPVARQAAKQWLAVNTYNLATNPDGSTSYQMNAGAQPPPWDPTSQQAPLFMDWPHASFNPDGTVKEQVYAGGNYYDENYKPGDLTSAKGAEDSRLDKAYQTYSMTVAADQRLPMSQWYYATAGGAKPVDATRVPGTTTTPAPVDPMVAAKAVSDKISQGQPLTAADLVTAKTQNVIPQFTSAGGAAAGITGDGGTAYLKAHPDGNAIIDGALVKLVSTGRYTSRYASNGSGGHTDFAEVTLAPTGNTVDTKHYWLDKAGNWYDVNPITLERNGQLTPGAGAIASPIKK